MIDIVLDRFFAGLLTGVTLGTLFYLFPVFRHIFSHSYRNYIRDKYADPENFKYETIRYFKLGLTYGFVYGFLIGEIIGPYNARFL